jgi:hypothetical protein
MRTPQTKNFIVSIFGAALLVNRRVLATGVGTEQNESRGHHTLRRTPKNSERAYWQGCII